MPGPPYMTHKSGEAEMSRRDLTHRSVSLRKLGLLTVFVSAVIVAAPLASPSDAASRGSSPCATVAGGKWSMGPLTGNKWQVYVTGTVSCAMGKSWIARVTKGKAGPAGWHCAKSPLSGACSHPNSSHQFAWAILAKP
jgi:hypothetical protein